MSGLQNHQTCNVLVVEPTASLRHVISDVIRGLGYDHIHSVGSGKEALEYLEVENPHWIVSPSLANQEVNLFQILKIITQTPRLRNTCCTLLCESDQENYLLPLAFELGLFSWHQKSYSRDMLESEFNDLFSLLNIFNWNTVLVSSEFIRRFSDENKLFKSRLVLDENLLSLFPGSERVLVNLAESQFLNEKNSLGKQTLRQVTLLNQKLAPVCKRIAQKYLKEDLDDSTSTSNVNALGIKSCVVIEPDTDMIHFVRDMLEKIGLKGAEFFDESESAYQWLKTNPEPQLIIMEWRVPPSTGPILIQRIRNLGYHNVPIIVTSSQITKEEEPLAREMGVDFVLKKPYEHEAFLKAAVWAIQQTRNPTEQKPLETKIRRLLASQKVEEAKRLIAQYFSDPRIEEAGKLHIEAEFEFAMNRFASARDFAYQALKKGGDSLFLLNLIGKCMLKLSQFEGALKCFEKANLICPLNIERFLDIADAHQNLADIENAEKAVEHAKSIDAKDDMILSSECSISIQKNNIDRAKEIMEQLDSSSNIISFMNNRAISLARAGRFEEGINLYKRTLSAIPKKLKEEYAAVSYNVALAYARYGDLEDAVTYLKQIDQSQERIWEKAQSLSMRIRQCIAQGTKLEIQAAGQDEEVEAETAGEGSSLADLLTTIEIRRGDICCHQIFFCVEGVDPNALELVKDLPKFTTRSTIERDETYTDLSGNKASGS